MVLTMIKIMIIRYNNNNNNNSNIRNNVKYNHTNDINNDNFS